MSLNVYITEADLPNGMKYIKSNDAYFNAHTVLADDNFTKTVLQEVDNAKRVSDLMFSSTRTPQFGGIFKNNLSTGTKALLNIAYHPDMCFNSCEIGENAVRFLCQLHDGNIIWEDGFILANMPGSPDTVPCDIMCSGIRFTEWYTLVNFIMSGEAD